MTKISDLQKENQVLRTQLAELETKLAWNVSAREMNEKILVESSGRFHNLFETMAQGVIYQDVSGVITLANPAAERILGLSLEQLQGRLPVDPRWHVIRADGTDFPAEEQPANVALRTGQPVKQVVMGVFHPQKGEYRWVLVNATPVFEVQESHPSQVYATFSDITESRRAEEILKIEQTNLEALIENTDGSIWSIDTHYQLLIGNTLYHQNVSAALGRKLSTGECVLLPNFPPKALEEWQGYYDRALRGERFSVEVQTRFTDSPHFVEYSFTPIKTGAGAIDGVTIFGRDVTERKLAEAALQEREQKLSKLLEILPVGVSILDAAGKLVFENPALEKMLNINKEGLLAGAYKGRQYLAGDGAPMPADGFASVQAARQRQAVYSVETGVVKEDGEIVWMSVSAVPVDFPDWKTVIVTADITEGKQAESRLQASEAKFRAVFDNAPVGISLLDRERNLLESNEMLEQIVRISEPGLLAGAYRNRKYIREDGTEIPTSELASTRAIVERRAIRDVVNGIVMENGEIRWTQVSAAPLGLDDPRFVVITQDITERKKAEQKLRESEELFRASIEFLPIPIALADTTGQILRFNQRFTESYGYTVQDLPTIAAWMLHAYPDPVYRAEVSERWNQRITDSLESDVPTPLREFKVTCKDGSQRIVEIIARGVQGLILASFNDITERKQVEEALRESEARFSTAFLISPVAQSVIAQETNEIMAVNDACCRLFEYSHEELIGASTAQLSLWENPADRLAAVKELQDTGHLTPREATVRVKSGEIRAVIVAIEPIAWQGLPCLMSSVVDITERKQTEELIAKLARFPAENPNPVLRVSLAGDILYANQASEVLLNAWNSAVGQSAPPDWLEIIAEVEQTSQPREVEQAVGDRSYVFDFAPVVDGGYINVYGKDMTERKLAEGALRESEAHYRLISENAADVIWVLNPISGKFTYVSPSVEKLRGYTPAEVLAQPVSEALTPASLKMVSDSLAVNIPAFIAQGSGTMSFISEVDQPHKNGSIINTEVTTTYLFNERGEVEIVGVSRDITARRKVEAALRQSETLLTEAQRLGRIGHVEWNGQGEELTCSAELYEIFGLPPETLITQRLIAEMMLPEERQRLREMDEQAFARRGNLDYEYRIRRADGQERWLHQHGQITYSQAGIPIRLMAICQDITERKRSENALRQSEENFSKAFRSSPAALLLTRLSDGRFIELNEAYCAIVGYERHELLGHLTTEFNIFIHPADRQAIVAQLQAKGSLRDFETSICHRSGAERRVVAAQELITFNGEACILSSLLDITQRQQAENALKESEHRYRELVQNANSAIIRWSRDGTITFINEYAQAFFGYRPEEIIGQSVGLLVPAAESTGGDLSSLVADIVARPEQFINFVNENICKDGRRVWMTWTNKPIFDEQGQMLEILAVGVDITEQKRVEDQRQKSELLFRTLFELSPDAVIIVDPHDPAVSSSIVDCNTTACLMNGYAREELIGQSIEILNAAPYSDVGRSAYLEELRQGTIKLEVVHRRKDGTCFPVETSTTMITVGERELIIGIDRDITERKQIEARLVYQANLLANVHDAIIGTDAELHITYWNKAAEETFGWRGTEIMGQDTTGLFKTQFPNSSREKVLKGLLASGQYDGEVRYSRKNGEIFDAHARSVVLRDAQGQFAGLVSSIRDISERKQAEAALQKQAEQLREQAELLEYAHVLVRDMDNNIVTWNQGMENLYGWSKAEALGKASHQFFQTIFPVSQAAYQADILQNGHWEGELTHIRKDGSQLTVVSHQSLYRDINGEPLFILEVNNDITERKLAEAELHRTLTELERSNAELEQFAYVASHDLQEPLRAVAGMVQLLQKKYGGRLDERADEYIGHAVEAAGRMQALINDLLAYSRVDRRGKTIEPVSAQQSLDVALANLQVLINETEAEISCDAMPTVLADPSQLTQVFQNLIGNALKFRGEQRPKIQVKVTKLADADQFAVCDNGIGIEAQYFERIFLVFQRLHTRREYPGTGIGLALCKKIIDRHGGRIWVEAQPGQGSTFYFTLPARRGE